MAFFKMQRISRLYSTVTQPAVLSSVYQRVLGSLPDGIQMAFAYGSGVFQQEGQTMANNMLDFILVVDNPRMWHAANIKMNKSHYSFLANFGPRYVSRIQERYGAEIYFNTHVRFEQQLIKYGVISTDSFVRDLFDWDTLYVSGRLHKPVKLILLPKSQTVTDALHMNLQSAIHAALLLLPETFTEQELYMKIAGLSYSGDLRMTFGEDKGKVRNIVKPNIARFRQLYEYHLVNQEHVHWHKSGGCFEQFPSHVSQFHHLNLLPRAVQEGFVPLRFPRHAVPDLEEVIRNLAHDADCAEYVEKSIANITKKSSFSQSVKGVLTAGVNKTIKYSYSKIKKMWNGSKKS